MGLPHSFDVHLDRTREQKVINNYLALAVIAAPVPNYCKRIAGRQKPQKKADFIHSSDDPAGWV